MSQFPQICLIVALVLFGIGAFSRWWASQVPYYPAFISAGLFFWVLSIVLGGH